MIKHFCDICGKEAKPGNEVVIRTRTDDEHYILPEEEWDGLLFCKELCCECARDIVNYIIGKSNGRKKD